MLRRLFVCGALVLVFPAPPPPAAPPGTLDICKSSANGMAGRSFVFAVGGSAVTVKGGRCTGAMLVPAGNVAITELAGNPATDVSSVAVRPSSRNLGLAGHTATVTVVAGSTISNETL